MKMDNLGNLFKTHRKEKGLTQPQLAELIGIGYKTLQDIEAGKPVNTVKKIEQINAYLDREGLLITQKNAQSETQLLLEMLSKLVDNNTTLAKSNAKLVDKISSNEAGQVSSPAQEANKGNRSDLAQLEFSGKIKAESPGVKKEKQKGTLKSVDK